MNPCPCGYRGTRTAECRCDDAAVAKYVSKLSGPLLDRIDLQIETARVPFDAMARNEDAERSAAIRESLSSFSTASGGWQNAASFRHLTVRWERELKRRTGPGIVGSPHSSSMGSDDGAADREPHTHAAGLGGEEGIEHLVRALG